MKGTSKFLLIAVLMCCGFSYNTSAQVAVENMDGTAFPETWCCLDTAHPIRGVPAGGYFTGCGISSVNGVWYFNPAQAGTGETRYRLGCSIRYFSPFGDSAVLPVSIHKPVVPDAGGDRVVCSDEVTLSADMLYAGVYDYSWLPAAGLSDPAGKITKASVADSQTYVILARDTLTGCTGSDTVTLRNRSVQAPVISTGRDVVCSGDSVWFGIQNPVEAYTYQWDLGDGTFSEERFPAHRYAHPGWYPVSLTAANADCSSSSSRLQEVRDFKIFLESSALQADAGTQITLTSAAAEPYTVRAWRPETLFAGQTGLSVTCSLDTTRTYRVIGQSSFGCTDSAEVTVTVNPRLMMPSAFSPNGDGRNDRFRLVTWGGISQIRTMQVFDRWGRLVFGSTGAGAAAGWDGTVQGVPAETGVYYYRIDLESDGKTYSWKGDVSLLR